jgi:hypothetical protein
VSADRCERCLRPTLVNGTYSTAEICWSSVDGADAVRDDRAECDRLTLVRALAAEAEAERLRGVVEAAEALVRDWGCDAPMPCMSHGPRCRRCDLAFAFTAAAGER